MATRRDSKLNRLQRDLPEGLLVDASWLTRHGYSTSLRSQYVQVGWLEKISSRAYRRPQGRLRWQQVVISLQTLLNRDLHVGGRSALEAQGLAHYLSEHPTEANLYGAAKPPTWLATLPLQERFTYRNSTPLFRVGPTDHTFPSLTASREDRSAHDEALDPLGLRVLAWGQWDWPMVVATPERAVLELLDELPARETFHQVDMLMEGLSSLSPRRLQTQLTQCRSVKVKRLFFFFADRHAHAWADRLDRDAFELGTGKRVLVPNGRLDPVYQITVPKDLEAPR